jgi:hypothetical protein
MGGSGGGTQRTTTETQPVTNPGLQPAYNEFGNFATQFMQTFGPDLFRYIGDQTPQQIAGPTGLENRAYQTQSGLLNSPGPQAWSDALGMYSSLGNLPQWQGVDMSGITGWGTQPTNSAQGQTLQAGGQQMPGMQSAAAKSTAGGADQPDRTRTGTDYSSAMAAGLDPTQIGSALGGTNTPEGSLSPNWTLANPNAGGVNQPGMGQAGGSGTVREVTPFDMNDWMKNIGSGGGSSSFNFSSGGGGGGYKQAETIGNPLETIDFANHPALRSALETFAKTTQPGIENAMIGAGLGRSGAAGNAIETGKAQIALPVMEQLIQGELTNKGLDVTQRGQDYQAQAAANAAAAQARAQGASLQQQKYMADLAFAEAMRGQDVSMRGQDIGLRQQDINALLAQGDQALQARGMDINALLGGAQGLTGLGQADLDRINQAIGGSMDMGGAFRGIQNEANQSQFNALNRPYERIMQLLSPIAGGALGNTGTTSVSTQTGGGK